MAAAELAAIAPGRHLLIEVDGPLALQHVAEDHDRVDSFARRRVMLSVGPLDDSGAP
ncbi:MAG: hypothetical protein ACRDYB_01065 [Acidimicrobiales bacterium]